jgi:exodeoxyribonuclease V alpha subunit
MQHDTAHSTLDSDSAQGELALVPAAERHRETVCGVVERVIYHNPQTGFCVTRVKLSTQRLLATVVGHAAAIVVGEFVEARGGWINDRRHGYQFRADSLRSAAPSTADGVERYLGSGMLPGVGPVYAQRLVAAFGARVFDVIEREPKRLRSVPGIGAVKAQQIAAAWADQKAIRDLIFFLRGFGIGVSRALKAYKVYGPEARRMIADDPYRLMHDVGGITFAAADAVAAQHGIRENAPMRLRAGLVYVLREAARNGHCGLPLNELTTRAADLLETTRQAAAAELHATLADGDLVADTVEGTLCVFQTGLHRAERDVAARLRMLAGGPPSWTVPNLDVAIGQIEVDIGIRLSEGQRQACRVALASKVSVVTGGPGVGKTTLIASVVALLRTQGVRTLLCAATGRAAKRLTESTGVEARTIHRLLALDPMRDGAVRRSDDPLDCDLLVVDEVSMVDVVMMGVLLGALPPGAALMLVGDGDQLPSIGPGHLLRDVVESGLVPVARLTEVFRQATDSAIVRCAHCVNRGEMPDVTPPDDGAAASGEARLSDFYFVEARDQREGLRKILHIVRERIPRRFGLDPVRDVQVLCPMMRGSLGARSLNIELQKALNPPLGRRSVERFGWTFSVGDKVMQVENDYDRNVYNGDLGVVAQVDEREGGLIVDFDGRAVPYGRNELDQLVLAYAITIHKAQGSEYPSVVIPVTMQHRRMLCRNLIYTAITRGKRLVVLVGEREALQAAIATVHNQHRWSKLKDWLRAEQDRQENLRLTGD